MNKRILGLALPNIITNITVPLLGMVDMAIVGHLSAAHIGAIAIGAQIFNLIYWNFGFLRMGTSGFTAQAYGAKDHDEAVRILYRALSLALLIAGALLVLQWPLSRLALLIFDGSPHVLQLALTYFFIRIWAAPATLGLYAVKGWFIGMQNSKLPMWIAIFLNCVNIVCSLVFVLVLHWDIAGVALGTVIAQYSGLALGLIFLVKRYGQIFKESSVRLNRETFKSTLFKAEFFKANGDIFLRTICLATVFTFVTAASGRISDEILAVDALLMQFFTLFSYIMDGFAYAGESLVGRYIGARESDNLRHSIKLLLYWGLALTILFTALYELFGNQFLRLFSDSTEIIAATHPYLVWILLIPICGFSAFLFDGIYIGATASKAMRNCMFVATAAFFLIYYGGKTICRTKGINLTENPTLWNHILWCALMVYLSTRGISQALLLKKTVIKKIQ